MLAGLVAPNVDVLVGSNQDEGSMFAMIDGPMNMSDTQVTWSWRRACRSPTTTTSSRYSSGIPFPSRWRGLGA